MKRVVITGGSGKVGRASVKELLQHGYEVINLDIAPPREPLCRFTPVNFTDYGQVFEAFTDTVGGTPSARNRRRENTLAKLASRTLGRSGVAVSPLGLGCWAIGGLWEWLGGPGGWGEVDDAESLRADEVMRRRHETGYVTMDQVSQRP